MLKLIGAFQEQDQWDQAIEYSQVYLKSHQTKKAAVAINLAKIQLLQKDSPRRALKAVGLLGDGNGVSEKHRKAIKQIKAKANQMIAAGAIELD